ncbi:MAG: superoxide dismutase [Pseudomonadales bacterium]
MKHELPDLPYPIDALEPHISAETLDYHHGKHHRKYVDKLNALIRGTEFERMNLEEIIGQAGDGAIYNNAGQAWNHAFYWQCMSPQGGGEPHGQIAAAIDRSFNSYDEFKQAFDDAAAGLFGSGWVWLVKTTADTVNIQATKDADNPLRHGRQVLMTCDLWEHAFYIDYRNDKSGYMNGFWNVVNWDFVNQRLISTS